MDSNNQVALTYVSERIAQRYAHPGRAAYLYLFRLQVGSDFSALVPSIAQVIEAWIDEGQGLKSADPASVIAACSIVRDAKLQFSKPTDSPSRKRQMSRAVLFSVDQTDDDSINVRLISRAVSFTPKGDREVNELWRRTGTGEAWYSTHRPQPD
jgi:hypothetical protein